MACVMSPFMLFCAAFACGACASAAPLSVRSGTANASRQEPAPPRIQFEQLVVTPHDTHTPSELLAAAHERWGGNDARGAVELFDAVKRLEPAGDTGFMAGYWAALASEESGNHADAAHRFEALATSQPEHPLASDTAVRAVRLLGFSDDWPRASELAERWLGSATAWLPQEEVALHSARALGLLQLGRWELAEHHTGKASVILSRTELDRLGVIPRDVAQFHFARAELQRRRTAEVALEASDFPERFERRARLLLDAQAAYFEVMRARDAHWSSMAGFRLGEMYVTLHRDVMAMQRPVGIPDDRQLLFEAAMRARYGVLLEKGLMLFERTLALADRAGSRSEWVARVRADEARLRQALEEQRRWLDRSGYTRGDLARILEAIQARQGAGVDSHPNTPRF